MASLNTFVSADTSNANGSNNTVNNAEYAFYRKYEYGYRVTVYVGTKVQSFPSDRERLSAKLSGMSLSDSSDDFYYLGQVDLVNGAMGGQIRKNTIVGGYSKTAYREDAGKFSPRYSSDRTPDGTPYSFWKWNLPVFRNPDGSEKDIFNYYNGGGNSMFSPDAVALGDSDEELTEVKYVTPEEFFLSRTTLNALLRQISYQDYGNEDWFGSMFDGAYPVEIISSGRKLVCGEDVWAEDLDPLERANIVPFVVVYEPLVLVYLRESSDSVLFTPTEFALSQGTYWNWFATSANSSAEGFWPANGNHALTISGKRYDYTPLELYTGGKRAQAVQSLVFASLPASVYLDESWFGHPKFSETVRDGNGRRLLSDDGRYWSVQAIVESGGWGMEFFAPAGTDYDDAIDLGITPVLPNAPYEKGKETVTAFNVSNASSVRSIFPYDDIKAEMTVTDTDSGRIITKMTGDAIALPTRDSTVVWFAWDVPENVGDRIQINGRIVFPGGGTDITPANNSCGFTASAGLPEDSRVRTEGYLTERVPSSAPPADFADTAYWSEWRYEEGRGGFVKYSYSCRIVTDVSSVPDAAGHPSENPVNGKWTVKSGYGFETDARAKSVLTAVRISGGTAEAFVPEENYAVSQIQRATAHFPENLYSSSFGKYETMEAYGAVSGEAAFRFRENPDAEGDRIHYMPLSYPDGDGNYAPYVIFGQCWTPAGMIEAGASPVPFSVNGSLFDDWYSGR
ncbi:MAG: hypothetical protein MJ137_06780 [Clostridia bacterium]|nr:hypothetical protein [Clostridia bacterium]